MRQRNLSENLTFVVLKQAYDMPCERDMFYDRRRKFYWALSRVRKIYKWYYEVVKEAFEKRVN